MRLLFVADEIPDELERIVMFLNAQMPNVEVLAVEIKQFKGKAAQTLVPRVIGRIADSSQSSSSRTRSRLSRESFLGDFTDEKPRSVAERLLNVADASGAYLEWGSSAVSIRVQCPLWQPRLTVAWFCLPSITNWMGRNQRFHVWHRDLWLRHAT